MATITIETKERKEVFVGFSNSKAQELFEEITFHITNSKIFYLKDTSGNHTFLKVFLADEVTSVSMDKDE